MQFRIPFAALALAALGFSAPLHAAEEKQEPILLEAPEVTYDSQNQVVTASGGVEVSTGGRVLLADEIVYDQKTGVVTARGNVSIMEPDGDVAYADEIKVSDDLRDGVIQSLTIVMAEDARMAAAQARRTGGMVTELENVIFTPCKICRERGQNSPLWQIKARRVVHDKQARTISYEDASFEFFGTEIAWLPYFTHADLSVKRQSGFLVPGIGNSTDLGYFIETPYYWAPSPSFDVTVSPFITTDAGQALKGEYRQRFASGGFWLQGSLANIEDPRDGDSTVASHLFGEGRFRHDEHWSYGFDVALASSDTYMERYEISREDRLQSDAFVGGRWDRSHATVTGYYFQGLRDFDDVGTTPFVLPLAEASYYMPEKVLGGRVRFDGNLMLLQRTDGADSRRISAAADWRRAIYAETGEVITLFANLRGDLYHANDINPLHIPGVEDSKWLARVLPMAGIDYRWPWAKAGENVSYVVEPIVQVIAAPYGGNPEEIPNEDSASFEYDDTNLFSAVKFPGLDRWESGVRANVGLRGAAYFDDGGQIEVLLGQNFRLREDSAFSPESGLGDQESDYVGRIYFAPDEHISLTHRFRFDKDDFSASRNEIFLDLDYKTFDLTASYVLLDNDNTGLGLDTREEASAYGRYYFSDYWSVHAGARRDFENDEMIESRAGITYEDECSAFELTFRRQFTRDRDAEPNSTFIFRVRLKALGEDGT